MLGGLKKFNLPEIEERVLKFWKDNKIFEKSVAQRGANGGGKIKKFVFFEGPPTANGQPGVHHVLVRVFKDIILRYKTMRGFLVSRRAGWDTQGLPVEIEVEKELGIKTKQEIEKFGIAEFNRKAKESVWKYKEEWERLTERIGFWLDFEKAYITYTNDYLETLWWIFKEISKRKLLKKSLKVVPYCSRCQTALSSHELGQPGAYRLTKDPSAFIKLRIKKDSFAPRDGARNDGGKDSSPAKRARNDEGAEFLLIWTTTPWTLPANAAIAVNPKLEYRKYKVMEIASSRGTRNDGAFDDEIASSATAVGTRNDGAFDDEIAHNDDKSSSLRGRSPKQSLSHNDINEYLIWSAIKPPKIEGVELEEIDKKRGKDLVGWKYEPLYPAAAPKRSLASLGMTMWKVYAADFVSAEEGTGLVHIAPAFGEDDFNLMKGKIKEEDIPITVDDQGRINGKNLPGAGKFAKEADEDILADLKKRKLLYHRETIEHEYPFCWRCAEPLLYMARHSWFIEMSKLRADLRKENQKINWVPDYVKEGRFGNWLAEAKDWAISRERFWGTPLPIWQCHNCRHSLVVGGLDDLKKHAAHKNKFWVMRHGEATHNCAMTLAGDLKTDHKTKLTPLGVKQAEKTADLLKQEKIDLIYCSPFQRTRQTCEAVSRCVKAPVTIDERIKETNFGVLNDKSIEDFRAFYSGRAERFEKRPDGGENWRDVKRRAAGFIIDINRRHSGKNILIISHGDPIWFLEGIANNLSDGEMLRRRDDEGSMLPTAGLRKLPFDDLPRDQWGELDLHRPFIDEIKLACPKCGGEARRVAEVADVWFDSGAMPFAQWHYPFENKEVVDDRRGQFPADYICEAIDQTRGWFYTLLAVSVLLKRGAPYKNVISLGLLVDKYGQKMSKSKGNAVDSWRLLDKYGADALRWYFYTINQPGDVKKFDEADVGGALNKVLLMLYNSYKFWEIYGDKSQKSKVKSQNLLDRWITARCEEAAGRITNYLDKYKIYEAAGEIEKLIDDLSRWYIRRSRKRFQQPSNDNDWREASAVLRNVLMGIAKLLAPFTPFFAEALYGELRIKNYELRESVHLEEWPEFGNQESGIRNQELLKQMAEVRRLAGLVLAERAEAGIKVRQPLSTLRIRNQESGIMGDKELLKILAEEVNVKKIIFVERSLAPLRGARDDGREIELNTKITAALKKEGLAREVGRLVQGLRQDAGLEPKDKIALYIVIASPRAFSRERSVAGSNLSSSSLRGRSPKQSISPAIFDKDFKRTVNADSVDFKKTDKFDAELETKLEDDDIWLGVRRI